MNDLRVMHGKTPEADEPSRFVYEKSFEEEIGMSRYPRLSKTRLSPPSSSRTLAGKTLTGSDDEGTQFKGSTASSDDDSESRDAGNKSPSQEWQMRQDAVTWAAAFEEPKSADDIIAPPRHDHSKKRKAGTSPIYARAKRLKDFYNNDYRELLNNEISSPAGSSINESHAPLKSSLIGSTLWSAKEKHALFSALPSLGKSNTRALVKRIGSKSELEVRDYLHFLDQGSQSYKSRFSHGQLNLVDIPAAFEISHESASMMEIFGDAVASRQGCAEEEAELAKWGEYWLLTDKVAKGIAQQTKAEESSNPISEKLLPAVNLFRLKTWLNLSKRMFMNAAAPREEENWQTLSEPGETPAIRATAFEDLHSLAVVITKRLVNTTLYSTMSRQRAMGLNPVKHAEVNITDVEAAIKILGFSRNCNDFWVRSPRKCGLQVVDDTKPSVAGDRIAMSYDEVERVLSDVKTYRSRSQSLSQSDRSARRSGRMHSALERPIEVEGGEMCSGPEIHSDPELLRDDFSDGETYDFVDQNPSIEGTDSAETHDEPRDESVEAHDACASCKEEHRLLTLLRQPVSFESKGVPTEFQRSFPHVRNQFVGTSELLDTPAYWSPWEIFPSPVTNEPFVQNRRKGRRRTRSNSDSENSHSSVDGIGEISDEDQPWRVYPTSEGQVSAASDAGPSTTKGLYNAVAFARDLPSINNSSSNKEVNIKSEEDDY